MLGCSIFLGNDINSSTEEYINQMIQIGCIGIFTSAHIPEDDATLYRDRLQKLGNLAKKYHQTLMVDISSDGLKRMNISLTEEGLCTLLDWGITGIRMDYGISTKEITKVSQVMTVGLNASTLTENEFDELKKYHANVQNLEFWHNYYPRKETGLDPKYFYQINQWIKSLGGKIIAFAPGDNILRKPIYMSLPTLEHHRLIHPLASIIDLINNYFVDQVYIGDEGIQNCTLNQIDKYLNEDIIELYADIWVHEYRDLVLGMHYARKDMAKDVVRCAQSRMKSLPNIHQINTIQRDQGSITLDNHLYGRYMGEFQIARKHLPADERVNVMGSIRKYDLDLISCIQSGQKFYIKENI